MMPLAKESMCPMAVCGEGGQLAEMVERSPKVAGDALAI
jgi:hypothetical protein